LAAFSALTDHLTMTERFERHRQPWTPTEIQKLHQMANKGMSLKAICNSLTRSEESVKIRAKLDKLLIAKLR
jgi:hypothetical protein